MMKTLIVAAVLLSAAMAVPTASADAFQPMSPLRVAQCQVVFDELAADKVENPSEDAAYRELDAEFLQFVENFKAHYEPMMSELSKIESGALIANAKAWFAERQSDLSLDITFLPTGCIIESRGLDKPRQSQPGN